MSDATKFCRDCKFCQKYPRGLDPAKPGWVTDHSHLPEKWLCERGVVDLVSGDTNPLPNLSCRSERSGVDGKAYLITFCGEEGRFFQNKKE